MSLRELPDFLTRGDTELAPLMPGMRDELTQSREAARAEDAPSDKAEWAEWFDNERRAKVSWVIDVVFGAVSGGIGGVEMSPPQSAATPLEQASLCRRHVRKLLSSQDFRNAPLVDAKKRGDLMVEQSFLLPQKTNFGGHFGSHGRRGFAIHGIISIGGNSKITECVLFDHKPRGEQ